jgi:hypothetical protein
MDDDDDDRPAGGYGHLLVDDGETVWDMSDEEEIFWEWLRELDESHVECTAYEAATKRTLYGRPVDFFTLRQVMLKHAPKAIESVSLHS